MSFKQEIDPGTNINIVLRDEDATAEQLAYSDSDNLGLLAYRVNMPTRLIFFPWTSIERVVWDE